MEPDISSLEEVVSQPLRRGASRIPRIRLRGFGLRASERAMLLFLVDVALMVGSLVVALKARTDWLDTPGAFTALWRWWVSLTLLWWIVATLAEGYDLARAASAPHSMLSAGARPRSPRSCTSSSRCTRRRSARAGWQCCSS